MKVLGVGLFGGISAMRVAMDALGLPLAGYGLQALPTRQLLERPGRVAALFFVSPFGIDTSLYSSGHRQSIGPGSVTNFARRTS